MNSKNKVQSFSIYKEYYDLITLIPKQERAELLLAISEYMFEDKDPELNDNQMKIFNNLKRPLDKSKNKSKNGTNKNQNENKSKSNENQNENKSKSNENQNESKTKTNKNQNENKTKTHQDVIVIVNKDNKKEDRVIGEEEKEEEITSDSIIQFIEKNFGRTVSGYEYEQIQLLIEKYSQEIVQYAFEKTLDAGKKSLNYTKGILSSWEEDSLETLEEIKEQENSKPQKSKKKWWEEDEQKIVC